MMARKTSPSHGDEENTQLPKVKQKGNDTSVVGRMPTCITAEKLTPTLKRISQNGHDFQTIKPKTSIRGDETKLDSTSEEYPQPQNVSPGCPSVGQGEERVLLHKDHVKSILLSRKHKARREVMHALQDQKLTISLKNFNDVLAALSRERRLTDAASLAELAEQKPLCDVIISSKSVKTFTIMIDLYGKLYQLPRAFSLFNEIGRKGMEPTVVTYNSMITACSRCDEHKLALEVFQKMQQKRLKPDKYTYGSLIDSCAKSGNVEGAFHLSQQMDENGVGKDHGVYSSLMETCGRANQLDRALEVLEEMKKCAMWPNMVTFSVLIDTCANTRNPELAFELFAEAQHWGYTKPNVVVYTALIDACSKGGWPGQAELVMKRMIGNGIRPNQITYGALMEGWARKGDFDRAFAVLHRMAAEHNLKPNAVLLGGLIDACRRRRECSRITDLWNLMERHNIKPARPYYPGLITMAVSHGSLDLASAIVLHAYARGMLRRVALNSENPTQHALACALIYFRHELTVHNGDFGSGDSQRRFNRLRVAFNSVAMGKTQIDGMLPFQAREFCLSWGDLEPRDTKTAPKRARSSHRKSFRLPREVHRHSQAIYRAKNFASEANC